MQSCPYLALSTIIRDLISVPEMSHFGSNFELRILAMLFFILLSFGVPNLRNSHEIGESNSKFSDLDSQFPGEITGFSAVGSDFFNISNRN